MAGYAGRRAGLLRLPLDRARDGGSVRAAGVVAVEYGAAVVAGVRAWRGARG